MSGEGRGGQYAKPGGERWREAVEGGGRSVWENLRVGVVEILVVGGAGRVVCKCVYRTVGRKTGM